MELRHGGARQAPLGWESPMMYEEIGLEPIESAASEESIPVAWSSDPARELVHSKRFHEKRLDERLLRIIKALDR